MQEFTVQIKAGAHVRLSFPVMAASRTAAQMANEGLCAEGEQAIALTPAEARERFYEAADLAYHRSRLDGSLERAVHHREVVRQADALMRDPVWGDRS